jgi:hypothetical protein
VRGYLSRKEERALLKEQFSADLKSSLLVLVSRQFSIITFDFLDKIIKTKNILTTLFAIEGSMGPSGYRCTSQIRLDFKSLRPRLLDKPNRD